MCVNGDESDRGMPSLASFGGRGVAGGLLVEGVSVKRGGVK
jgi:hypothetical protein